MAGATRPITPSFGSTPYRLRVRKNSFVTCSEMMLALQPFKRRLVERTEGNPFFLEEIVRTLVETKVLTGARGAYRLTKALDEIQVPATVQAVLAARIDRLPPEEKRLLQSAAVIGERVPFTLAPSCR